MCISVLKFKAKVTLRNPKKHNFEFHELAKVLVGKYNSVYKSSITYTYFLHDLLSFLVSKLDNICISALT